MLCPTPKALLTDQVGRPYFLWDVNMTLEEFGHLLRDPDLEVRAYSIAKLMRQAKPDDVFQFVTLAEIRSAWPKVERRLGFKRPFWSWLLYNWERLENGGE